MSTILYRKSLTDANELTVMSKYFKVADNMVGIQNDLVIGRYSAVPFYDEVERGLQLQGSKLINSWRQHRYIANFEYYHDITDYTPRTWFRLEDVPEHEAPFVVKGVTNSKKHEWLTMMYAETKADAIRIAMALKNDYYIGSQDIIVRKYVPIKKLGQEGTHGLPFTNEWRCFFYKEELLSYGFYWTEADVRGDINEHGIELLRRVTPIISQNTNFYTVDIGELENGFWVVVEINDAQMAGLSDNSADQLYSQLAKALT